MIFNKLIYLLFFSFMYSAIIVGTVKDEDGSPIIYANVYLKDTFDGTSSDDKGSFAFETFETGNQTLIISFIGYESYEKEYNVDENLTLDIILKQLITRADEVVITAGSFGASDDEKVRARRVALLASRTNTALSIPMLLLMTNGLSHRALLGL